MKNADNFLIIFPPQTLNVLIIIRRPIHYPRYTASRKSFNIKHFTDISHWESADNFSGVS